MTPGNLEISISSYYVAIDDSTSNWWLKMSDVKRQMVSLGICQQHQTIILVILYQCHIFSLCENVFERHLREVLLYFFSVNKSVVQSHRLLMMK